MDSVYDIDEGTINLSKYTVEDSCFWLLHKLDVHKYDSKAYTAPFCNYVTSWCTAVPLTAIIMGQNPYPNDIFPEVAAAMSYDEELCSKLMKHSVPPTVEILANDLYIHANFDRDKTTNIIKDGWALVKSGILLVNDAVFNSPNSVEGYRESEDQRKVIMRLLEETEKYGKRTVEVYALGESGQKMASALCSTYNSDIVRLSKRAAKHPAGVARRFSDFSHPDCHLESPSFSKSLAKCLSNQVALVHTMSKKNELDARTQRNIDANRSISTNLPQYTECINELKQTCTTLIDMDLDDKEKFKSSLRNLYSSLDNMSVRTTLLSAMFSSSFNTAQGMSSNVARSGPSLNTINPVSSPEIPSSSRNAPVIATDLVIRKKRTGNSAAGSSSFENVSSPPSIKSVSNTVSSDVTFRKSSRTKSAASTQSKERTYSSNSQKLNTENDVQSIPTTPTNKSTHFRNQRLTETTTPSETSGQKDSQYSLTKQQINQLSTIHAVVQVHKDDFDEDEEAQEEMANIQNDIACKTLYNSGPKELVECINRDSEKIPNFNLADWAVPQTIHSETFEKCKELFNF